MVLSQRDIRLSQVPFFSSQDVGSLLEWKYTTMELPEVNR